MPELLDDIDIDVLALLRRADSATELSGRVDVNRAIRDGRRRALRHRLQALGAVAACALVVAGLTVLPRLGDSTAAPPAGGGPLGVDTGVLSFRGVQVTVPSRWVVVVGVPAPCAAREPRDLAYVEDGSTSATQCGFTADEHPERRSRVILQPWDLPKTVDAPPTGERVLDDGRTQVVRRIADREVRLIVISPDRELAQGIAASARVMPSTAPTQETDQPAALEAWLEQPNPYTADVAAAPFGGRVYCETFIVSGSPTGTDLYVWALCGQVYLKDGRPALGASRSGPVVMHVRRSGDAVTGVLGMDYPREQSFDADVDRLFPKNIRKQMRSGDLPIKPRRVDLLELAQVHLAELAQVDLAAGIGVAPPGAGG